MQLRLYICVYFYLFIVGSEVNVAIFSCNLFECKHVIWGKLGGAFDGNDMAALLQNKLMLQ